MATATQIGIIMPYLQRRDGNLQVTKGPVADDASSAFYGHSFVLLNGSGLIAPVLSAGTTVYGWCVDGNHATTDMPPTALYANRHWVFDPKGCKFLINISNGGTVGVGGGVLANVTLGTEYGLVRPTTGTYAKFQMLDYTNVTQKILRVVGFPDGQASTDLNPLVIVEVIPTIITG